MYWYHKNVKQIKRSLIASFIVISVISNNSIPGFIAIGQKRPTDFYTILSLNILNAG